MDVEILKTLESHGESYIVGSRAIEMALNIDVNSCDVDLLIETDVDVDSIKESIKSLNGANVSFNSFGGIRVNYNGVEYDIWRVKDTRFYEEGFEKTYASAGQVIQNFAYNLYQVGVRADGIICATPQFIEYVKSRKIKLINKNIANYEKVTKKAEARDKAIRKALGEY